jgi:putative aldouronate transport system permease protein
VIRRTGPGDYLFMAFNGLFLTLVVALTLYPFVFVLFASISDPAEMAKHMGFLLAPLGFSLGSYGLVLRNPMILAGYTNTLLYMSVGTSLNLLMTSLGAYVLSRKRLMLRNLIMFFIVFTMFFSGGLIPYYLVVRGLGLANRMWSLIVPTVISTSPRSPTAWRSRPRSTARVTTGSSSGSSSPSRCPWSR